MKNCTTDQHEENNTDRRRVCLLFAVKIKVLSQLFEGKTYVFCSTFPIHSYGKIGQSLEGKLMPMNSTFDKATDKKLYNLST